VLFPPRDLRGKKWADHLVFALKHEGLNMEVLAALLERLPQEEVEAFIGKAPLGRYSRLVWFLFEWMFYPRVNGCLHI
jgi:hypothetical protein